MNSKTYGDYPQTSVEGIQNATDICNYLLGRGWTLNSVCGLLGNIVHESGLNPWRWESDNVQPRTNYPWTNIGYGLVQFTPASKYIADSRAQIMLGYAPNFSDFAGGVNDWQAQLLFLNNFADYYPTSLYPLSYSNYKTSYFPPEYLASAWLRNYERPKSYATENARRSSAIYFYYDVFNGQPPEPVIVKRKLPIWMYKPKYRIERR